MALGKRTWRPTAALACALMLSSAAAAQTTPAPATTPTPAENAAPTADNAVMLTVFLKHDQSRPLSELKDQPSLEICSSVTTRSTFSDLLLMRYRGRPSASIGRHETIV